jgi:hypothetical protein
MDFRLSETRAAGTSGQLPETEGVRRPDRVGSRFLLYLTGIALLIALLSVALAQGDPDAITPDGGRYYGPLVDGKRHGRGKIEWDNGARYFGAFEHGLYSGTGRYQSASGAVYEGEYRKGVMEGRGRFVGLDGSYVGEFRNDDFNGQGRHETRTGHVYEGHFSRGLYDGKGKLTGPDEEYVGNFEKGLYAGTGEVKYKDGRKYKGLFLNGEFHGKGRFDGNNGEWYEGDFEHGDFTGNGTFTIRDGGQYKGKFVKWQPHGPGAFTDPKGNLYEGTFVHGDLSGTGRMIGKDGSRYEGEFRNWQFHGRGVQRYKNGDVYKGSFAYGLFDGEGTYFHATVPKDGRSEQRGNWRYGSFVDKEAEQRTLQNVEAALYQQSGLLAKSIADLAPRSADRINLYLLAVGGDGKQEVFRREVEFVKAQFDRDFGTQSRSMALVNSRNTVEQLPMATVTSIRESINGIANRMDKEKDILFLYLTSHGSKTHELTLDQNGMDLRSLGATQLASLLKESGIRWKVIVVSACYSGGFIAPLKDDHTMIITASRADRTSFGCADENDFTYFGKAFFHDALPQSASFDAAFIKAKTLVAQREAADFSENGKVDKEDHSEPQMHTAAPIRRQLERWWAQEKKVATVARVQQ